mgnify:CR=1 FL=1
MMKAGRVKHFIADNISKAENTAQVKKIFLVHGDENVSSKLIARLTKAGFNNIITPNLHNTFKLN